MGRIKTRWFYTELVEHYLRMAVRYKTVSNASSQHWFDITKDWIDRLSDEDKQFIRFVFDKRFYRTIEGLCCFDNNRDLYFKRVWLAELEKKFALEAGFISEYDTEDNMGE